MTNPTLKSAKVVISHRSSDGFCLDTTYGGLGGDNSEVAKHALLCAHRETARLLSLYGYGVEARAVAEDAHKAVAAHLKQRGKPYKVERRGDPK